MILQSLRLERPALSTGLELHRGVQIDIRKDFCTKRAVGHWTRLPRVVVESPSLEGFETRVDVALGVMV